MGVPTVLLARTDAEAADLLTSDVDENDRPHCTGERTVGRVLQDQAGLRAGAVAWPRLCALRRLDLV